MYSNLHLYVRATTFIASMCTALLCNKYGCFEGWAQTSAELFDLQRFTESVRCVKKNAADWCDEEPLHTALQLRGITRGAAGSILCGLMFVSVLVKPHYCPKR
jgi:hypothetical protein